jgi:4-amino-4-deoxy-L-arabinose transferase-like glycosyltransferase
MNRQERMRIAIVLGAFAIAFASLTVSSYVGKSATADEPINLTAGYTMLKLKDYRIHPDNMPLLRMWAALPLLAMRDVQLNTNSPAWVSSSRLQFSHDFLYKDNDADRMLYRARFMNVLLGVVLGALLFSWAREWFGFWPAAIALLLFATEPNILAHTSLVTTDIGVTCFMFGTVYFAWRFAQRLSVGNLAGLTVFFVLGAVSKFTALLLLPILLILLLVRPLWGESWHARALRTAATLLWLAFSTYIAVWAVYSFRYAPTPNGHPFDFSDNAWVLGRAPRLAVFVHWIDAHHLLPNACTQGFLLEQARGQRWPAYLAGRFSMEGWWYYFPIVFLIKTPIALLVLFFAGLGLCVRQRANFWKRGIFALLPLVVGFAAAIGSKLDVGLRHILPLYPFVLLVASAAVSALLERRSRCLCFVVGVLCAAQIAELAAVYPHNLAFFNQLVGGPRNGYEWLADSNIDWGQDLKTLKRWMERHDVTRINLSYFGSADPAYYGIECTYLPGSPFFAQDRVGDPVLPGYVAVSIHNLTGAGLAGNPFYRPLLLREPVAVLGYSMHVYWLDGPWW